MHRHKGPVLPPFLCPNVCVLRFTHQYSISQLDLLSISASNRWLVTCQSGRQTNPPQTTNSLLVVAFGLAVASVLFFMGGSLNCARETDPKPTNTIQGFSTMLF